MDNTDIHRREDTASVVAAQKDSPNAGSGHAVNYSPQQLRVIANPNYERLVKLVFEGKDKSWN